MQTIQQCRRYEGAEEGFWPLFIVALATAAGASQALLLRRPIEPAEAWKPFAAWPAGEKFPLGVPLDDTGLTAALDTAVKEEIAEFRSPADPKNPFIALQFEGGLAGW